MTEQPDRLEELERFLGRSGARVSDLLGEAVGALDEPELVVATGSVLQGYGNGDSDVDVHVVVDRDGVTTFPVMTYSLGVRVDMTFHSAEVLRPLVDGSITPWPGGAFVDRSAWMQRGSSVDTAMRLAVGATLDGSPSWCEWVESFRSETFYDTLTSWWQLEAFRRLTAARWLLPEQPLLASQRYLEAMLAALEVRACRQGERYTRAKWLPERFARQGDQDGVERFRDVLRAPVSPAEAGAYADRCEGDEMLLDALPDRPMVAHLSLATGVHQRSLPDRWLLDRWGMRCAEVPLDGPVDAAGLEWIGSPDTPDAVALGLFLDDLAWLGVSEVAA